QDVAPAETAAVFACRDLSGLDAGGQQQAMQQAAVAAQASLDIENGPLLRAVLFTFGAGRAPQLFVTVHHLVVDGVSWRILLSDLETAYHQLRAGQPADLGPATTDYRRWARQLTEHVRAGRLDADLPYWAGLASQPAPALPPGRPGSNTAGSA